MQIRCGAASRGGKPAFWLASLERSEEDKLARRQDCRHIAQVSI